MFEDTKYVSSGKFISRGKWIHPSRIIDTYEVIFVLEGSVFINENGVDYCLDSNSVLVLQPGVRHIGFKESRDVCFYWLHFKAESLELKKHFIVENHYHLSLLFSQLLHFSEFQDNLTEGNDYLTRLILIELYRAAVDVSGNGLAYKVAEYIRINSDISLKVQDVADHFGYNADHLNRVFRAVYGKNIKNCINDCKMQYIKTLLLTTDDSLQTVSEKAGFLKYKYFLKFFKYHENMTPTEFLNVYFRSHMNNK